MQIDNPHRELSGGMARWLMSQRKDYGWGTTNETAFAILGLTDYLRQAEGAGEPVPFRVALNGEEVLAGELSRQQPSTLLDIPLQDIPTGDSAIEFTESGTGSLYYLVIREALLPRVELPREGPLVVERVYLDPETEKPLTHITAGQLVLVRMDVTLTQDQSYMLVEDYPPAGLEPLNERLNTSSYAVRQDDVYDDESGNHMDWLFWKWYGYNYKELRQGRVSFFISSLREGQRTFTYYARATHAGSFVALPAQAWAMYDLSVWGRSVSQKVIIEE